VQSELIVSNMGFLQEVDMRYCMALTLNNVGVGLLIDGCYRQAAENLRDALSVLKELTFERTRRFSMSDERLIRARRSLENPFHEVSTSSTICIAALVNDHDFSIFRYSRRPSAHENAFPILFPVYFQESRSFRFGYNHRNAGFDLAIILFNLAIAYKSISTVVSSSLEHHAKAIDLLKLSYRALVISVSDDCCSEMHASRVLHVGAVVLQYLHAMLDEAEGQNISFLLVVSSRLDRLRRVLAQRSDSYCMHGITRG
jgi:hypothetical protein